jgi:hypothetical protein
VCSIDCNLPDPPILLLHLEAMSMSRLFGAVAADRHAAPSTRVAARVVGEYQRTDRSLVAG